ncbi:hypothetical protein A2U01_0107532, partial [Trifolium medium]|nr:hypothetical protein [Trifolium medium]
MTAKGCWILKPVAGLLNAVGGGRFFSDAVAVVLFVFHLSCCCCTLIWQGQ